MPRPAPARARRRRSAARRRSEAHLPARYRVAVVATGTIIAGLVYIGGVTLGPALAMLIGVAALALILYVSFANGEAPRPSWRSRWHDPDRLLDAWMRTAEALPPLTRASGGSIGVVGGGMRDDHHHLPPRQSQGDRDRPVRRWRRLHRRPHPGRAARGCRGEPLAAGRRDPPRQPPRHRTPHREPVRGRLAHLPQHRPAVGLAVVPGGRPGPRAAGS